MLQTHAKTAHRIDLDVKGEFNCFIIHKPFHTLLVYGGHLALRTSICPISLFSFSLINKLLSEGTRKYIRISMLRLEAKPLSYA